MHLLLATKHPTNQKWW